MKLYKKKRMSIKAWAEEDRPREKLMNKGKQHLSDSELLALLIRTGSHETSAIGLSQELLNSVDNNLFQLGKYGVDELKTFKGIGEAKAIAIIAAMELGRRRQLADVKERAQVKSSRDAYQLIAPLLSDLKHEEFWVLMLDRSNKLLSTQQISIGGVSGTVVDAKLVYKKALAILASSIVLCHNHPSGNLKPSQADISLTKKLQKGGASLDITVLDHLIISELGFYSFADEGLLR